MPWASTEATSFLMTIAETCSTLEQAGFQIELVEDRSKAVADFFSQMASNLNANPNPLGLQLVMGNEAPIKIGNLMSGFESGIVKPVLIIANRISVPDPV